MLLRSDIIILNEGRKCASVLVTFVLGLGCITDVDSALARPLALSVYFPSAVSHSLSMLILRP